MGLEMTKLFTLVHTAISAQNASTETVSDPSAQQPETSLIRRKDVERLTGLSRSRIYDLMSKGKFPKPVSLGAKSVAWLETEAREWIAARIAERKAS
jgi:prophage regulatory protein